MKAWKVEEQTEAGVLVWLVSARTRKLAINQAMDSAGSSVRDNFGAIESQEIAVLVTRETASDFPWTVVVNHKELGSRPYVMHVYASNRDSALSAARELAAEETTTTPDEWTLGAIFGGHQEEIL